MTRFAAATVPLRHQQKAQHDALLDRGHTRARLDLTVDEVHAQREERQSGHTEERRREQNAAPRRFVQREPHHGQQTAHPGL
jgi:hypothetical protein